MLLCARNSTLAGLVLFVGVNAAHGQCWLTDGLIAKWSFDEGTGSIAMDSSGRGNHGVIHGATWTNGVFSGALEFDGVDDYVDFGTSFPSLAGLDPFSVSAWIKYHDPVVTPHWIVGRFDRYVAAEWGLLLGAPTRTRGLLMTRSVSSSTSSNLSNGELSAEQNHHVCGVYDGSTLALFIDGRFDRAIPSGSAAPHPGVPVFVGASLIRGAPGNFFRGMIDEVRIYDRALTPNEVYALAQDNFCYADGDQSTGVGVLDIFDFLHFQSAFIAGDSYACDCEVVGGCGICDIFDFLCFQNRFVAGCN